MTTTAPRETTATGAKAPWVGRPLDRVDGPLKVAGAAPYTTDVTLPGMAHAALVTATIGKGRVMAVDAAAALALPGVVGVLTHESFPRLGAPPQVAFGWAPPVPLQDDRVAFHGQPVALVVAETPQQATEAARLVHVSYDAEDPRLDAADGEPEPLAYVPDTVRGDVAAGQAEADVRLERHFSTPENMNNPLGLMATVAAWHGDKLDVHDTTQWPTLVRQSMAEVFDVPLSAVRVRVPYLGGGFGAGLNPWPYKFLAVAAARVYGRPVKLVLTRPQMFTQVGHRPNTTQTVRLAATRDGRLTAIEHRALTVGAVDRPAVGLITAATSQIYACPNVSTVERTVRLDRRYPASMRGPGEAEGEFALEVALDELAYELGIDPLELRRRNHSPVHAQTGVPWSSNALLEAYDVGAERFGWADRDPRPGSMRDGGEVLGWGMATATYGGFQMPCSARISVATDGTASVRSAATDIGTGTYTVMTQLSADLLGLDVAQVDFDLGDTDMPAASQAGGSSLAVSLGHAIHTAAENLLARVLDLASADPDSPLHGARREDVEAVGGRIRRSDDPRVGESYADIIARHGLLQLVGEGTATPADAARMGMVQAGGFGARFVEVRIDRLIGRLRVSRVVTVTDAGRLLNEKLARSQIIGATVGGIGMALFEDVVTDAGTGRVANGTFGDYLVPVSADVPDIEVAFVGGPDPFTPTGAKGVGEIGLVGVAPAIVNAVFHATGVRVRDLPIHLEQLLG